MSPTSKDPNDTGDSRSAPGEPGAPAKANLDGLELAKEQARKRAAMRKQVRAEKRHARARAVRNRGGRVLGFRKNRAARKVDRNQRPKLKKLRIAIVAMGLVFLGLVSWVFGVMMAVAQDLPDLEARAQYDRATNSIVYANDGQTELTTLTGNEKRILLDSEEISPTVKQAVVAVEDERFYDHRGIDFLGIARALEQDVVSGGVVQGASTITQQFVKNALEAQG
ncbi:MAG: transglycosylase domain-containing protein, partial [Solirubrobacterales bacterium]